MAPRCSRSHSPGPCQCRAGRSRQNIARQCSACQSRWPLQALRCRGCCEVECWCVCRTRRRASGRVARSSRASEDGMRGSQLRVDAARRARPRAWMTRTSSEAGLRQPTSVMDAAGRDTRVLPGVTAVARPGDRGHCMRLLVFCSHTVRGADSPRPGPRSENADSAVQSFSAA